MNGAFVHLAVNHVPVVGVPIAFLLLLAGMTRKSRDIVQAGFALLVLMALVTVVAVKSGGPAAHTLMSTIQGIERSSIHEHAEAADYAVWGNLILGAFALIGLWLSGRAEGAPTGLTALILLGSLFMSTVCARVAHLGGLIRHPEIVTGYHAGAPTPAQASEDDDKD
jgi:hypothetical protein